MLKRSNLHDYQKEAVKHILSHNDSALWLQTGLGKTITTLTAIVDRMTAGEVKKTLIFGPVRVIESVWEKEAREWEHTKHLTFSKLTGAPAKRKRSLLSDADIYLVNYELMNWLAEEIITCYAGRAFPFQMVAYDEVSKLKKSTSLRMKGGNRDRKIRGTNEYEKVKYTGWVKLVNEFKYRVGLTGTPASNGLIDLHGQYLAIDGGKRLGESITHFKDQYFQSDYMGWSYEPTELGKTVIEEKIADITLKMDSCDYLDMPKVTVTDMMVDLPPKARKAYDEIEKEMYTALDNGTELEVFSRAAVSNKCLQVCNGFAYREPGDEEYESIHSEKLTALESILEEAGGQPVICFYSFRSDATEIMKKFKSYKPVNLTAEKAKDTGKIIKRWQDGKIKLMIAHPASCGYGIDGLQKSGSIVVWFGMNWSLELYEQACARINRQGQSKPVSIIRILTKDSLDLAVADSINRKDADQAGLKRAIDRYRKGETTLEMTFI